MHGVPYVHERPQEREAVAMHTKNILEDGKAA